MQIALSVDNLEKVAEGVEGDIFLCLRKARSAKNADLLGF